MRGHGGGVGLMTIFINGPWVSVSAKWLVAYLYVELQAV